MAPRVQVDPFPQTVAGPMTVKCECGWEGVFLMPEESIRLMTLVFQHFKDAHKIDFPQVCCYWH